MYFKLFIFSPIIFLFACDSNETRKAAYPKSIVDSLFEMKKPTVKEKEVVKASAPLEHEEDYKKTIIKQANEMNALLLKKEFQSFVKYANPRLLQKLGGETAMILALKKGTKDMEDAGNSVTKMIVDEPNKIIALGNELQTTLTETLEMKIPKGILVKKASLIATSTDGGLHWGFMDTSDKDLPSLRAEVPGLSEELIIPPPVQPKFLELKK